MRPCPAKTVRPPNRSCAALGAAGFIIALSGCAADRGEPASLVAAAPERQPTRAATGWHDLSEYLSSSPAHTAPLPGPLHVQLLSLLNNETIAVERTNDRLHLHGPESQLIVDAPLNEHGRFHGRLRIITAEGQLLYSCGFDDGRAHGDFRAWDEGGQLVMEERWHFGVRDGSI